MNQLSPGDVDHLHKGYDSCECNHGTSGETVPAIETCPNLCYLQFHSAKVPVNVKCHFFDVTWLLGNR